LWIAGEGGLYHIRKEQITLISVNHGLSDDTPFDVLEDNTENLWMPCRFGIMRISKREALDFIEKRITQISCKLYNKNDGMFNHECNPTTQSVKTANGNLYFATIEGLSQIEPANIIFNDYIPPVVIEEAVVDQQSYKTNKNLVFTPDKKRFTFHYTALSLYEPSKVQFKYILEGFDDEWTAVGNIRSVSYTNLKQGHYTFKVVASNNDGVWNNAGASFTFQIEPYFYQTAWFYLILLALLFVITYIFVQMRIRALKLRQLRLEKIIRDRTREIIAKNEELQKQKNEIMLINQELFQQKEEILAQSELLVESQKELLAVNAMKDKMFSIIAHDLRGPLGNLKSILEMAMNNDGQDEENSPENLMPIMAELTQLTFELLENLLNWSVSQRGLHHAEMQLFLIDPIVEDIIKLTKTQAEKKHIRVGLNVPPITSVYADINMVKTVFRNLISNAIKFTPNKGTIIIDCELDGKYVKFGIKDSGIGISKENQAKIFDSMENFTTFGTNQEKGSGLGLVLCRDLIQKNGGQIWFESQEGQGTTFYFTLFETPEAIEQPM
jgi:signal transduction histidine kinase